jgi:hypothetical protein
MASSLTADRASQLKTAVGAWADAEKTKLQAQSAFLKIQKTASIQVPSLTTQSVTDKAAEDLVDFLKS